MLHVSAEKIRLISALVMTALGILGCAEPVRENRTVEFSRDGGQVAFQHGDEGVYIADADGKGVTKIFQPDETVLATSRPLSCPTDGRLIFTTAQPLEGEPPPRPRVPGPLPIDGSIMWQRPVRYTCWLRSEAQGDQAPVVKKLFETRCGHIGYVSGGLAVRWHPDGKHVVYCAAVDQDVTQHSIFEFDLATEKSRRVFPHAASAVICDWTPAGSRLVCVVGDQAQKDAAQPPAESISGTWIGLPADDKSWWRVPGSERLAEGELPSVIEMLRASRPAWTRDDSQFAFVSQRQPKDPVDKITHHLQRVEFASRTISLLAEAEAPIVDVHWSPDGKQLGYVQRDLTGAGTLNVIDPQGKISKLPTSDAIRKFAGFDATGKHLAYVVANQPDMVADTKRWALLLISIPSRDGVRIASANAGDAGQEIFSGMHVTFPLWSPTEEKLSLWLTFTPRYRSLLSMIGQMGLWPGDPAATIDAKTGAISWMAVSPQEELQIGHYYLLKRNAAEAWRWYERARQKMPAPRPPANWEDFVRRMGAPENSQLFEYICLKRLGRDAEADAKWAEFDRGFYPLPAAAPKEGEPPPPADPFTAILGPQTELMKPLIRDLFVAEVFLSVDGLDEALAYFRKQPAAETDVAAFSRAVILAQLLLIARDHENYLAHCTDVVAPLALKLWQTDQPGQSAELNNQMLQIVAGLCLAPLFRPQFIEQLPRETVQQQMLAWKKLAAKHDSGMPAVAIDLVLRAGASKLEDPAETKRAEEHIVANPAGQQLFSGRPIDEVTASWFDFAQTIAQRP